jgi:hypothetical protein
MTEQRKPEQGGIATMEPMQSIDAPEQENGLGQAPLEPGDSEPSDRPRGADRRAARDLKRAERAERRPERKARKLGAAIVASDADEGAPAEVAPAVDEASIAAEAATVADAADLDAVAAPSPLAQEAMPEPIAAPTVDGLDGAPAAIAEGAVLDAATGRDGETAAPGARNAKRADRLQRKAARQGEVQDGAPAPSRAERRADRAERKAQRPAKAPRPALNGSAAPVEDANEDGADPEAPRSPVLVRAEIGAVVGPDAKAKRTDRQAGRIDVQRAAAEEALSAVDPGNAAIAPLIRYVNAVSLHLNESQKLIGKLQIERDALRAQVISLDAEPIDATRFAEIAKAPDDPDASELKQQRRSERRAAKEAPPESEETAEDSGPAPGDVGRKRRLIALGLLAAIGLVALGTRIVNHPVDLSNMSKGSLGGLAVVGQFMQVFLAGMIFYRLARIGGRAGRWLFPENDPKMAKKQQQQAKAQQKKARHADA